MQKTMTTHVICFEKYKVGCLLNRVPAGRDEQSRDEREDEGGGPRGQRAEDVGEELAPLHALGARSRLRHRQIRDPERRLRRVSRHS